MPFTAVFGLLFNGLISLMGESCESGFRLVVDLDGLICEYLFDLTASIMVPLMMADCLELTGLLTAFVFFAVSAFLEGGEAVFSFLDVAKIFLANFFAISFLRLSSCFCFFS